LLGAKSRRDVACAAKLLVFMGLYFAATLLARFAIFELAKLRSNHAALRAIKVRRPEIFDGCGILFLVRKCARKNLPGVFVFGEAFGCGKGLDNLFARDNSGSGAKGPPM
jgi:hypothetical protein